jgi:hypothetical protein
VLAVFSLFDDKYDSVVIARGTAACALFSHFNMSPHLRLSVSGGGAYVYGSL